MKDTLNAIAKELALTRDEKGNKRKVSCNDILDGVRKMKRRLDDYENATLARRQKIEDTSAPPKCDPSTLSPSVRALNLPDPPAETGISKYDCFRDDHGRVCVVVGYTSQYTSFGIVYVSLDDATNHEKVASQQNFRTSYVAKQIGTGETLRQARVAKFWKQYGGEPRPLFWDERNVVVADWTEGGCHYPIVVKEVGRETMYRVKMKWLRG